MVMAIAAPVPIGAAIAVCVVLLSIGWRMQTAPPSVNRDSAPLPPPPAKPYGRSLSFVALSIQEQMYLQQQLMLFDVYIQTTYKSGAGGESPPPQLPPSEPSAEPTAADGDDTGTTSGTGIGISRRQRRSEFVELFDAAIDRLSLLHVKAADALTSHFTLTGLYRSLHVDVSTATGVVDPQLLAAYHVLVGRHHGLVSAIRHLYRELTRLQHQIKSMEIDQRAARGGGGGGGGGDDLVLSAEQVTTVSSLLADASHKISSLESMCSQHIDRGYMLLTLQQRLMRQDQSRSSSASLSSPPPPPPLAMSVIWAAPFFSGGGYCSEAIDFAVGLDRTFIRPFQSLSIGICMHHLACSLHIHSSVVVPHTRHVLLLVVCSQFW